MQDVHGKINYRGREYALVFNLNVMEQIQDQYGTLEEWGRLTDGQSGEPNAKAVKYGFWAMLNEGISIEDEENGSDTKPLTLSQVGRMITEIGMAGAAKKMNDTVVASTKLEDDGKKE